MIGIALFVLLCVGLVLLFMGAFGGDRHGRTEAAFFSGALIKGMFGYDQDAIDRFHPPERHPGLLMLAGAGLIVLSIGGAILLTVLGD
jgi:hypothetical protein